MGILNKKLLVIFLALVFFTITPFVIASSNCYACNYNQNSNCCRPLKLLYTTYEWKYAGKEGVSADLKKVQVVDLIPYEEREDFDVVSDGYTSAETGGEKIPFAS